MTSRIIVALSRAKYGCIVIGCSNSLESHASARKPVKRKALTAVWNYCKTRGTWFKAKPEQFITGLDKFLDKRHTLRDSNHQSEESQDTGPLRITSSVIKANPPTFSFTNSAHNTGDQNTPDDTTGDSWDMTDGTTGNGWDMPNDTTGAVDQNPTDDTTAEIDQNTPGENKLEKGADENEEDNKDEPKQKIVG